MRFLFITVACLTVTACRSGGLKLGPGIPAIDAKMQTQYEMRYADITMGTGTSAAPQKCFYAHYTGWLTNGTKFDSSRDTTNAGQPRTPLPFRQGARQVIPGWDSGFEGMRVGGKRRLFIPYQLAYGENGRPPTIPPKALLVFDVELMDVTEPPPAPAAGAGGQGGPAAQQRCPAWTERASR
jgi:peptidylprolyl isomerase